MSLHYSLLDGLDRLQIAGARDPQGEQRSKFPKTLRRAMLRKKSSLAVEEREYQLISKRIDPLERVSRHILSNSIHMKFGGGVRLRPRRVSGHDGSNVAYCTASTGPRCGLLHSLTGLVLASSTIGSHYYKKVSEKYMKSRLVTAKI